MTAVPAASRAAVASHVSYAAQACRYLRRLERSARDEDRAFGDVHGRRALRRRRPLKGRRAASEAAQDVRSACRYAPGPPASAAASRGRSEPQRRQMSSAVSAPGGATVLSTGRSPKIASNVPGGAVLARGARTRSTLGSRVTVFPDFNRTIAPLLPASSLRRAVFWQPRRLCSMWFTSGVLAASSRSLWQSVTC